MLNRDFDHTPFRPIPLRARAAARPGCPGRPAATASVLDIRRPALSF